LLSYKPSEYLIGLQATKRVDEEKQLELASKNRASREFTQKVLLRTPPPWTRQKNTKSKLNTRPLYTADENI
jgi:hypothetical protein